MKLSNKTLIECLGALSALDGQRDSEGAPKPYQLHWKATYAIARCITAIKPLVEAFEKARVAIVAPFAGGRGVISQMDPKWKEVQDALDPLISAEVEVEPHRFKVSMLQLEENAKRGTPIPGSVLSALLPILDDDTAV